LPYLGQNMVTIVDPWVNLAIDSKKYDEAFLFVLNIADHLLDVWPPR